MSTLQKPLVGTDVLKYGTLGKTYFIEKSLKSRWIRPHPETGFYFTTNQAPSFSLLLTWEKMIDSFFNKDKDLYFKSTSTYYSLLILCLMLFWLAKKDKYFAFLGILALLLSFSFFYTLMIAHLDSYRVFLLILSWIFLAYAIEKKDSVSLLLLGIFSGFAAFSHTIGAVLVIFNCFVLFVFMIGKFKDRLTKTFSVIILTIVFGWFHYLLDIIWGYGWIIFTREISYWG
jgi:hypothetical protein